MTLPWIKPLKYLSVFLMGVVAIASPAFAQLSDHQTPHYRWNLWSQWVGDPDPPLSSELGTGSFWLRLFGVSDPPFSSSRGVGRGDAPCLLTPVESEGARVWRDRPVFVWLGLAEEIQIALDGDSVWGGTLMPQSGSTEAIRWLRYGAEQPLEPGQEYMWWMQWVGLSKTPDLYFEVVGGAERQAIDQDLMALTQEYADESPETVALARAKYFADRNLWSDFWAELLSLEEPSPEVIGVMQETAQFLCSSEE